MALSRSLVILLLLVSCRSTTSVPESGQFVATWGGADQGSARMTASATWCAGDSVVEFLAREEERGLGLALYLASETPDTGRLRVVHPEMDLPGRPVATGAWRFVTVDALHAFLSRSGEVEVTGVGPGRISGRVTLHLVARSGPDTIAVRGEFLDIPLGPAPTPCGIAPRTPAEIF